MDFGAFDENVTERFNRFIEVARKNAAPGTEFCSLEDYKEMYDQILGKRANETYIDIRRAHWWKFRTSQLVLFSLGLLVVCFDAANDAPNPIAYDKDEFFVDPNFVLRNLILQIANHSQASLALSENGLESSARIMNRAIEEQSWLLLALVYDRQKLRTYINDYNQLADAKKAKRVWRENFSPKHLLASMEKIEALFKDDSGSILKSSESRKDSYSRHSSSVHGDFIASMLLSHATKEEGDVDLALFGSKHFSSNSLEWVAANVSGIYLRLFPMLRVVHNFNIGEHRMWNEFVEMSAFAVMTNLNIKIDQERHDLIRRVFVGPLPFEER